MRATSAGVARTLTALVSFVTSAHALDYLIVGGGTAGLVLANRLTEDASVSVMVLEAGGDGLGNTNISAIAPLGLAWGTDVDWSFPIEPLQFANNRAVPNAPRGKVLGGSSSINGDVFDRGDSVEYDEWEILGNAGWNSKSILAAAFKGEKFTPPNATWNIEYDVHDHGLQGLLDTSFNAPAPSFHDVIIDSVVNAGGIKAADVAGGKVDGISHVTNSRTPSNATRSTSATGYYFPYSYRSNMQVTLFVTVTKVIWASTTPGQVVAAGVEYIDSNGTAHTLNATNVILAGGVWGSPPILERSGVGNATFLASLGIDTVIDLPGVGENMQEQTLLQMSYELNVSIPDVDLSPILINFESLQKTVGENRTELEALLDIQPPNLSNALYDATKRLYQANAPWVEHFALIATSGTNNTILTIFPVNLHPLSRGSCHIVSTNGTEYPVIKWNWFEAEFDTYVMATAAKRVQDIVNTPPLSDWISAPIIPANLTATVNDFGYITLANAQQADHPLGTALMAPREDGGVVDANLKVYGTTNLYVIDASVIPLLPAAHLQGTVYALAERAADLLRQ